MHRKKLISKLAVGGAAAALALGAAACDVEDDDLAPGQEEPVDGFEDDGLEGDGLEDDGLEGDDEFDDLGDEGDL